MIVFNDSKPKVCAECNNWQGCFTKEEYRHKDARCGWCMYNDAIDIPVPHGDLIDRDKIIKSIKELNLLTDPVFNAVQKATIKEIVLLIKSSSTVIESEKSKGV